MQKSGSVTVYLSLIFIVVSALICGLLESARTAGVRFYLQTAADSAIDSVFSNYYRKIWDDYGLIFLQCSDEERAIRSFEHYLQPYLENSGRYRLTDPNINILDVQYATDEGGAWFEREILDFMKYNILDFNHTPDTSAELLKNIEEAKAMKEITSAYGKHSKEAAKLEKALSKISNNLKEQKRLYQEVGAAAAEENSGLAKRNIKNIEKNIRKLDKQLAEYIKKAEKLSRNLEETQEKHKKEWEELSESNREILGNTINSYKEYTEQDGARRVEVNQKVEEAKALLGQLDTASDILEEIEEWEGDEEDEDEEIDMLWSEFDTVWESIEIPIIESGHGIADEEKEDALEAAGSIFEGGFLDLVLPEGREVSDGFIETQFLPSKTCMTKRKQEELTLLESMIIDEYACRYFADFTDASEKEVQYELEYIINGEGKDPSNLSAVLLKILAIREGMNYMHIITDSQKMEEVKTLASLIAGATGVPGLMVLFVCLIIGIWALGESILDLRALLGGKKVPIFKSADDWRLDLEGLLDIGRGGEIPEEKEGRGIDYQAYLRLLLLVEDNKTQHYRMMDIIQHNMAYTDEKFRMNKMVYAMHLSLDCKSHRLFSSIGLVRGEFIGLNTDYRVEAKTLRAY